MVLPTKTPTSIPKEVLTLTPTSNSQVMGVSNNGNDQETDSNGSGGVVGLSLLTGIGYGSYKLFKKFKKR